MSFKLSTKEVVGVAIGAALFGVLMVYGGITVFTNTKLSSAYVIPVIIGALFGPIPAALVGLIGNFFADFLGGWGYWIDWSIGNFFACFFIGSLQLYGARIKRGIFTTKHALIFSIVSILGIGVSFGLITPLLTLLLFSGEVTITFSQAFAAVISNATVVLVVGIPLLFGLSKRYESQSNLIEED